jgi:hypothetical protein
MAYLNNQYVTIDAVLTRKGRELLARNDGSFQITQFALADDEIDYTLYNPNHPSGSAFFGEAIEAMPLLEAFVDETQMLKYKLVTLPRGTSKLPVLNLNIPSLIVPQAGVGSLSPQTLNYLGAVSTIEPSGYLVTIGDARYVSAFVGSGVDTTGLGITPFSQTALTSGTNLSFSQIGTQFSFTGTTVNTLFPANARAGTTISTTLTVTGRDSGARLTIPFTLKKT